MKVSKIAVASMMCVLVSQGAAFAEETATEIESDAKPKFDDKRPPFGRKLLQSPQPPIHPYAPLAVRIYNLPAVHVIRYAGSDEMWPTYPGPNGSLFHPFSFGSIALERRRGYFGYSWAQPTAYDAERAAMKSCGDADCEVVVTVQGGCAAVAARGERTGKLRQPVEYLAAVGRNYDETTAQFSAKNLGSDPVQLLAWTCNFG